MKGSRALNRTAELYSLAGRLGASGRLTVAESEYTLEADLLGAGPANEPVLRAAYLRQHPHSEPKWQEIAGTANPAEALYRKLHDDSRFISKGEFAHDVAIAIQKGASPVVPPYLTTAITRVQELERQRHEVVHSTVLHTHRAGLSMYLPRSGSMVRRTTRKVVELAAKACKHAEDGNYMSIFDWPSALGLGPRKVGDASE